LLLLLLLLAVIVSLLLLLLLLPHWPLHFNKASLHREYQARALSLPQLPLCCC
jgi:hypothetical protein